MGKPIKDVLRGYGCHQVGDTDVWVGWRQDERSALREAMDSGMFDDPSEAFCAAWRRLRELERPGLGGRD